MNTNKKEKELIFDDNFRATIRDNELHIFFYNGDYEIYNADNLDLKRKSNLDLKFFSEYPGFFKTQFIGNEMLFKLLYAQPSPVSYGPATIDLTTGEILTGLDFNLVAFWRELGGLLNASVGITTYSVDLKSNLVVVGFENTNQNNKSGGVVYSNFDGEILKIVELEFIPDKIIIR